MHTRYGPGLESTEYSILYNNQQETFVPREAIISAVDDKALNDPTAITKLVLNRYFPKTPDKHSPLSHPENPTNLRETLILTFIMSAADESVVPIMVLQESIKQLSDKSQNWSVRAQK